jgi:hypothetical protein
MVWRLLSRLVPVPNLMELGTHREDANKAYLAGLDRCVANTGIVTQPSVFCVSIRRMNSAISGTLKKNLPNEFLLLFGLRTF